MRRPDDRSSTACAAAGTGVATARTLKASDKGHRLTPQESRFIDTLVEKERAEGHRRKQRRKPELDVDRIVEWAVEHHARTGEWPGPASGVVCAAPGETWRGVGVALLQGHRGLPGGTTLARLLAERVGKPHRDDLPRLSEDQILAWADSHHARTGDWPKQHSGTIPESPCGDTWNAVYIALRVGRRGLSAGTYADSLAH
jgi:hypothetical protein